MKIIDNKPVFGKDLKYLVVLALLAWMTYSLPSVQAAIQSAAVNEISSNSAAAVTTPISAHLSADVASVDPTECPVGYICTPNPKLSVTSVLIGGPNPETISYRFTMAGVDRIQLTMTANGSTKSIPGFTAYVNGSHNNALGQTNIITHGKTITEWQVVFTNKSGKDVQIGLNAVGYSGKQQVGADADTLTIPATPSTSFCPFGYTCTQAQSNAQANVSLDPSSPAPSTVSANSASYAGLPVLVFDVNAQNSSLTLSSASVHFNVTSGSGSLGTAYLYQGSTLLDSAAVINGTATFSTFAAGTTGTLIPLNATVPYVVKVDVSNVGINGMGIAAAMTSTDVSAIDSYGNPAKTSGTAFGNIITVSGNTTVSNMSTSLSSVISNPNATSTQTITFTYSLTAGNNPVYVSKTYATAVTAQLTGNIGYFTPSFKDNDSTNDGPTYFFIAPGQTKTFTATVIAAGHPGQVGTYGIVGLNYGTSASDLDSGTIGALTIGSSNLFATIAF